MVAALVCTLSVASWQALTVHYTYGGNWTALFCTGRWSNPPAALLQSENIYVFENSAGYDGQFYHYIAHDPFFRNNASASIDSPALRYRRILVPGLAYLLALGHPSFVDAAYLFIVLEFVFLGAYWLSRFAFLLGFPSATGLFFAAVPAVLISMDRLTVDVALAACSVGFVLYVSERAPAKLLTVLTLAALARETGLLLVASCVLWSLSRRSVRQALLFSAAAAPTAAWYWFVLTHTQPQPQPFLSGQLFTGLLRRLLNPFPYPYGETVIAVAVALDFLALAGILGALAWAFYRSARRAWNPVTVALYLFALLALALARDDAWSEAYAFSRTMTPLLLLAALDGLHLRSALPLCALLAPVPRIALQLAPQLMRVLHGITG